MRTTRAHLRLRADAPKHLASPAQPRMLHTDSVLESQRPHSGVSEVVPSLSRVCLIWTHKQISTAPCALVRPKSRTWFASRSSVTCANKQTASRPARAVITFGTFAPPVRCSQAPQVNLCNPHIQFSKTSTHVPCGYRFVVAAFTDDEPVDLSIARREDPLRVSRIYVRLERSLLQTATAANPSDASSPPPACRDPGGPHRPGFSQERFPYADP